MSGNEFEVGRVYRATVWDKTDVTVVYTGPDQWVSMTPVRGDYWHSNGDVTGLHPLIVLDLDAIAADYLAPLDSGGVVAALKAGHIGIGKRIADQIAAQITPPKVRMEEPGLLGAVSAKTESNPAVPRRFVRLAHGWVRENDGTCWDWADIIDPTLIREGVDA